MDGKLVGIAQVGRPVARALDDGKTCEVIRLCTDGADNACSFPIREGREDCGCHGV